MRKYSRIALAGILALSLTACGGNGGQDNSGQNENGGTSAEATKTQDRLAALGLDQLELEELSASDQKYTINLGYYDCDHMTAACIGEATGIFEALGLDVSITGNGNVPDAVSAGKMDAGYISARQVMLAIPKGAPIVIAANNHLGGSYYLVTSHDYENNINGLVGQKLGIGTNAENTSPNWVSFAQELGIPVESENYEVFDMSDKDKYFSLKAGQLDGYICCDPWASMAEYEGTGVIQAVSFYQTDEQLEYGKEGNCCSFALSTKFMEDHPELAKRLLLAHTKSIEYMYTYPYDAAMIFAEYYSVPEEVGLMTIYKKLVMEGRTITWDIEQENLENMIQYYVDSGIELDFAAAADAINTSLLYQSGCDDFETFIREKVDHVLPIGMTYEEFLVKAEELEQA